VLVGDNRVCVVAGARLKCVRKKYISVIAGDIKDIEAIHKMFN
jgi:hypothetical protein